MDSKRVASCARSSQTAGQVRKYARTDSRMPSGRPGEVERLLRQGDEFGGDGCDRQLGEVIPVEDGGLRVEAVAEQVGLGLPRQGRQRGGLQADHFQGGLGGTRHGRYSDLDRLGAARGGGQRPQLSQKPSGVADLERRGVAEHVILRRLVLAPGQPRAGDVQNLQGKPRAGWKPYRPGYHPASY